MIESFDEQWEGYPLWIATTVEIDIGIICASAPALRPLISKYMPKLLDQTVRRLSKMHRAPEKINKEAISLPVHGSFTKNEIPFSTREILGFDLYDTEKHTATRSGKSHDTATRWPKGNTSTTYLPDIPPIVIKDEWRRTWKPLPAPPKKHEGTSSPAITNNSEAGANARDTYQSVTDSYIGRDSRTQTIQIMMEAPLGGRVSQSDPNTKAFASPTRQVSPMTRDSGSRSPFTNFSRP